MDRSVCRYSEKTLPKKEKDSIESLLRGYRVLLRFRLMDDLIV